MQVAQKVQPRTKPPQFSAGPIVGMVLLALSAWCSIAAIAAGYDWLQAERSVSSAASGVR